MTIARIQRLERQVYDLRKLVEGESAPLGTPYIEQLERRVRRLEDLVSRLCGNGGLR